MLSAADGTQVRARRPELWIPTYGANDLPLTLKRMSEAQRAVAAITGETYSTDFELTCERISTAFELYDGRRHLPVPASYAFVVPGRGTRDSDSVHQESDGILPFLAHVDPATKQIIMAALCPFLLDTYRANSDGGAGIMMWCPITADITADLGEREALLTSRRIVADALSYCERLGASVAGLGATLPSLTNFGRAIHSARLALTTGHAGTAWLVAEMTRRLLPAALCDDIAIFGAGSIGVAIASTLSQMSFGGRILLHDVVEGRAERAAGLVASMTKRAIDAATASEALGAGLVIGAATAGVDLDVIAPETDLTGTIFVDDSQPACFAPEQVAARGGHLYWVVAEDGSPTSTVTKSGFWGAPFDYDGKGPVGPTHIWGCEAEVHALWFGGVPELAVRRPVSAEDVARMGGLLRRAGTSVAPGQRAGMLHAFPATA